MPEELITWLRHLAQVFEIVGAGLLMLGFVVATVSSLLAVGRVGATEAIHEYRQALGRTILIGLEVLVAATIIKTVTLEPTLKSIGTLAIMIGIRTALGWTTVLEMNDRWPWQKERKTPKRGG